MPLTEGLCEALDALPLPLVIVLLAATPIVEVRGSIPLALLCGMHPAAAFFWSLLGNVLVLPLLWWLLPPVERLMRKVRWMERTMDWVFARVRRKNTKVQNAERAGLFAIVALPLPGAGTWTAILVAYLFGFDKRKAWPVIILGAFVECAIILAVVMSGSKAFEWLLS